MKQKNSMQERKQVRWIGRPARGVGTAAAIEAVFMISGCGAWQATKDGTVDAAQWLFTTQVKQMNVDLDARAALNDTSAGQPLSIVVRLYQLKASNTFAQLEYVQLQNNDLELLKTDLVATKGVVMRPESNASINEPMQKDAEYVGVVAFFRSPSSNGVWKLLIPKKQWKDTDPVKVHVQGNLLAYDGAKPKPVKRDAPQQSVPASVASEVSNMPDASATAKAASQGLSSAANSRKSARPVRVQPPGAQPDSSRTERAVRANVDINDLSVKQEET